MTQIKQTPMRLEIIESAKYLKVVLVFYLLIFPVTFLYIASNFLEQVVFFLVYLIFAFLFLFFTRSITIIVDKESHTFLKITRSLFINKVERYDISKITRVYIKIIQNYWMNNTYSVFFITYDGAEIKIRYLLGYGAQFLYLQKINTYPHERKLCQLIADYLGLELQNFDDSLYGMITGTHEK
jgi:hypothetical protein